MYLDAFKAISGITCNLCVCVCLRNIWVMSDAYGNDHEHSVDACESLRHGSVCSWFIIFWWQTELVVLKTSH